MQAQSNYGIIVTCTQQVVSPFLLHVQGFVYSGAVLWAPLCLSSDLWDLRNLLLGGLEDLIMTDGLTCCKASRLLRDTYNWIGHCGNHQVPLCVGCCFVMGSAKTTT